MDVQPLEKDKIMKKTITILSFFIVLAISACGFRPDLKIAKDARKQGDYETAYNNYKPLSDFGIPEAQTNLALLYLKGNGVEKNPSLAFELMSSAAKSGYTRAKFELARIYEKGLGTKKDINAATIWYQKAADDNYVRAYHYLANIYKKNDPQKAISLYEKAGNLGYPRSWYEAAKIIYNNGIIEDDKKAISYFEKAIEKGYFRGADIIASAYEKGISVKKDYTKALAYYYLAKKSGIKNMDNHIRILENSLEAGQVKKALKLANSLYSRI